ncbi:MAG: hypothetical protein KC657_08645 [Myxococcales bacterium]|nr:hypothetical protein [Myxococcales bacterium]
MSDKTTPSPFAPFAPMLDFWADAMRGQMARTSTISDEITKMERTGLEHLDTWMQESARITKAQLAYAVELGASMRKLGVEAMTHATSAKG